MSEGINPSEKDIQSASSERDPNRLKSPVERIRKPKELHKSPSVAMEGIYQRTNDLRTKLDMPLKEKDRRGLFKEMNESLRTYFPDSLEQAQLVDSATTFLDTILTGFDTERPENGAILYFYSFLRNFPGNMAYGLGDASSLETIQRIFKIGNIAAEQVRSFQRQQPEFRADYYLGNIARMLGERFPRIIRVAGVNSERVLTDLETAASSSDFFRFDDTVKTYDQMAILAGRSGSSEAVQTATLQMMADLNEVNSDITEGQFGEFQMKTLMESAQMIREALPEVKPEELITMIGGELTDELKRVVPTDINAGHIFLGQGIGIIQRGLKQELARGKLNAANLRETIHEYAIATVDVTLQLNAGRKGETQTVGELYQALEVAETQDDRWKLIGEQYRQEMETVDWKYIGNALREGLVERIIDLHRMTGHQVETQEIIGWVRGEISPLNAEIDRMQALFVYTQAVVDVAIKQGFKPNEVSSLAARTARTLNEFPWLIEERGFDMRAAISEDQQLSADKLSDAFIAVQRGLGDLLEDENRNASFDHKRLRDETRIQQLDRGFAYAMRVPLIRERLLRVFSDDAASATRMTRGLGIIEDIFRGDEMFASEDAQTKFTEVLTKFPDSVNIDTFLNALGRFMERYDQQQTQGQRQLHKDSLAVALSMPNPTETLVRMLEGNESAIKAVGWLGRLAEGASTIPPALNIEPAIHMLTEGRVEDREQDRSVVAQDRNANIATRIADSATPLGLAIKSYASMFGSEQEGLRAMQEKIGNLELRTVEDVQAFLPLIIPAMARYFRVPMDDLQSHLVSVTPASSYINEVAEKSPLAGVILDISAALGGGEVPDMAYRPHTNAIVVNENGQRGFKVAEVGEEVAHWVRELARNQQEDADPAVHEFYGFLGRRIVHSRRVKINSIN